MNIQKFARITALFAALAGAMPFAVAADTYPSKPIRLIVPVPPGGGSDALARVVATELGKAMKQSVVVDNRPGAGGMIGSEAVAKAPADGYTLLLINNAFVVNPWLFKLPFNAEKDFTPITIVATSPNVLVAHPSLPANNVRELIDLAKKKPGQIPVAVSTGQMSHVGSAALEQAAGIDLQLVPYKGAGAGTVDLIAGQVQLSFGTAPSYMTLIKSGKLKALGVGGKGEVPALPGIRPIGETLPGFEVDTWFGLFAPAGTPKEIVERLRKEVVAALKQPAVMKRLTDEGYVAGTGITTEQYAKQIHTEIAKWGEVVKKGNVKVE